MAMKYEGLAFHPRAKISKDLNKQIWIALIDKAKACGQK